MTTRTRKARSSYVRGTRIYWRQQPPHMVRRYYGDFRHVGGRQEALFLPGSARATDDFEVARALFEQREQHYRECQRRGVRGEPDHTTVADFAREHLVKKAQSERYTDSWLKMTEMHLQRFAEFVGPEHDLSTIRVRDVEAWASHLRDQGLSGGTIRHALNCVSNLYARAQAANCVIPGFNPVAAMPDKPTAQRLEARWLEVHEAALLLEAARTYRPKRADAAFPFAYPLIATALLTGGRPSEVLGLEVDDVSFDRQTVTFRPNDWRRLKTASSLRSVPLWPQLEEALRPYVFGERPVGRLLFPSYRTGREAMLRDARKLLDAVGARIGYQPRELNLYQFRHTYTACRLQSLDHGEPVSPFTVGRELGHGGDSLVKRVYGHLGQVRHRAEVVEYRVDQHKKVLGERLKTLAAASAGARLKQHQGV